MRDGCADEEDAPCALLTQLPEALLRNVVEVRDVAARALAAYAPRPACGLRARSLIRCGSGAALRCSVGVRAGMHVRGAARPHRRRRVRARCAGCMRMRCIYRDTVIRLITITPAFGRR